MRWRRVFVRLVIGMCCRFVFFRRRRLATGENVRKAWLHCGHGNHRPRRARRRDLLLTFRQWRARGQGGSRFFEKIFFKRRHIRHTSADRGRGGRLYRWRWLDRKRRISRHAHDGRATGAGDSFPGISFIALNVLGTRRTGKFQVTHNVSPLK